MTSESTVFLVKDDPMLRSSLQWLIKQAGLNVVTFESPEQFLQQCAPGQPGCVVLDLTMPGMSGLELHRKMQQQHRQNPMIILTSNTDVQAAAGALQIESVTVVAKPFSPQSLVDRINQVLNERRPGSADEPARDMPEGPPAPRGSSPV